MKDIYLTRYSVNGIKTIDKMVSLSFYKKTVTKNPDTNKYKVKGIYGANGSGKSGIITSVSIFKNLLINSNYLNNDLIQKNLDALINRDTQKLEIEVEFLVNLSKRIILYSYSIELNKDDSGKYSIVKECLQSKNAVSNKYELKTVFKVSNGVLQIDSDNQFKIKLKDKTANLLNSASLTSLFFDKKIILEDKEENNELYDSLCVLFIFGSRIHVYLDSSDDHTSYFVNNYINNVLKTEGIGLEKVVQNLKDIDRDYINPFSISRNNISIDGLKDFEKSVGGLKNFIKIFKEDLKDIEIEKKINKDCYVCNLLMVYENYKIDAEFESTGIKKLIKLYTYISEMVEGSIVFIDELDSNLHDVYLCALLEYLMNYGEGQLCFTTHNVGPMEILKKNKKSIDFLSVNKEIYSWKNNGNYSPSILYRLGMIEGSPFNVGSIDFIGIFKKEDN